MNSSPARYPLHGHLGASSRTERTPGAHPPPDAALSAACQGCGLPWTGSLWGLVSVFSGVEVVKTLGQVPCLPRGQSIEAETPHPPCWK